MLPGSGFEGVLVMGSARSRGDSTLAAVEGGIPEPVVVRPWPDPLVEERGFAVTAPYVEAIWLRFLGPSSMLALRRLALAAAAHPHGVRLSIRDLASELGL